MLPTGSYKLGADIQLDGSASKIVIGSFSEPATVTLDLAGFTLSGYGRVTPITVYRSLTIKNNGGANGKIVSENAATVIRVSSCSSSEGKSSLTIEGGTIEAKPIDNESNQQTIEIEEGCTITLKGGVVTGDQSNQARVHYAINGASYNLFINGGTVNGKVVGWRRRKLDGGDVP